MLNASFTNICAQQDLSTAAYSVHAQIEVVGYLCTAAMYSMTPFPKRLSAGVIADKKEYSGK